MTANSFGNIFCWTSFGESHGQSMGVVIEGCPAGLAFDLDLLHRNLERRRPGQIVDGKILVSSRNEADHPEILSGVFEGKTLGTPIAMIVRNKNQRSEDYSDIKRSPRVGHADDMWQGKFGHWDHRGGGRASARETVSRVMAGSVAQMLCESLSDIQILSFVEQIGPLSLTEDDLQQVARQSIDDSGLSFPSPGQKQDLVQLLESAKDSGESYGGCVRVQILNPPKYMGQPVFQKLKNQMANSFLSIGASVGVEMGGGFAVASMKGSELHTQADNPLYGGIRGGLSTGEDLSFRVAFKPTSSIGKTAKNGRHDPCIVPRAVPVVEAMAWSVLADHLLWQRLDRL